MPTVPKKARRKREEIQNALKRVAQEDDNEEENDDCGDHWK